ncbi:MAG: alpha/beta hydrolase [Solobacterium sp.]|nr:alpha/beta hydrolase [Solobacterium sp.]
MSLTYTILKDAVKLAGLKKQSAKSMQEILEIKRKANAKNRIPVIHDNKVKVEQLTIEGCPVLWIRHPEKARKANLFIIGGGMVSPPRPGSIRKAVKVAKQTGMDLFVPYYPLCTEYPLTRAYAMILETYRRMLADYAAEDISVLGTSSGGNLALGMIAYMNSEKIDLPRPGYILAISPGTCALTQEEKDRMKHLDEKDVAISAEYMLTAEEIMRYGDASVPEYMIYLQTGDFTGCPKVTFIYGSDENLYAFAPSFEAAMQKYHVPYEMIVGEGMFHCYPVFPICKEAKEGWYKMIALLCMNG